MTIFGAVSGFVVSLPLWWGSYQFYMARTPSVAKALAVGAFFLPFFSALVHAGISVAVWHMNEWLFARYTRGSRAP